MSVSTPARGENKDPNSPCRWGPACWRAGVADLRRSVAARRTSLLVLVRHASSPSSSSSESSSSAPGSGSPPAPSTDNAGPARPRSQRPPKIAIAQNRSAPIAKAPKKPPGSRIGGRGDPNERALRVGVECDQPGPLSASDRHESFRADRDGTKLAARRLRLPHQVTRARLDGHQPAFRRAEHDVVAHHDRTGAQDELIQREVPDALPRGRVEAIELPAEVECVDGLTGRRRRRHEVHRGVHASRPGERTGGQVERAEGPVLVREPDVDMLGIRRGGREAVHGRIALPPPGLRAVGCGEGDDGRRLVAGGARDRDDEPARDDERGIHALAGIDRPGRLPVLQVDGVHGALLGRGVGHAVGRGHARVAHGVELDRLPERLLRGEVDRREMRVDGTGVGLTARGSAARRCGGAGRCGGGGRRWARARRGPAPRRVGPEALRVRDGHRVTERHGGGGDGGPGVACDAGPRLLTRREIDPHDDLRAHRDDGAVDHDRL